MKRWILIIFILLTCFLSFANETTSYTPRDYSPIPPSPQVASIMKYNETPVNYFTGVPDISVPIFTVQSGNLSIPIALKYHGELLQTVNYYASGVPFTLTQGESATDRLHSGKQFIDHQGLGYYDNSARMLDVLGGRFTTLDPMATGYGHLSPYTNCAANPLKYTDPTGKYIETLWDVANVALGVGSLVDNIKQGNVGDAVLDGLGVVVDVAAVILPGVPGGAGAAIKGTRAADEVVDAVKAVDKVADISNRASKGLKNTRLENTVTFIQGKGEKAKKITVEIPEGYRRINERSKDAPIYTNGKNYITPDVHGHNGGVWKMSKKTNTFKNRSVRTGTYDKDLNRIGD